MNCYDIAKIKQIKASDIYQVELTKQFNIFPKIEVNIGSVSNDFQWQRKHWFEFFIVVGQEM